MALDLLWINEEATLEFGGNKIFKKQPTCSKGWGPCGYRCLPHTAKNCPSALEGQAKSLAEWLEKSAAIASPKPDTITPKKTAKAKVTGAIADFPDRLDELKTVKALGGSTGAVLVEDPATGQRYVMKRGNSPEHIREESAADAAYEALGINVPRHKLYETENGPVKLAEYIEGRSLSNLSYAERAEVNQELQKSFAVDALLGNWDVIGEDEANVILSNDGKVYRIDNGGSLRYRAQGTEKGEAWNDYPTELWSMRDPVVNLVSSVAFGKLGHFALVEQIDAIASKEGQILKALPQELHQSVKARISEMRRVAEISRTLEADQWKESYIGDFTKHAVGIRNAGITAKLPEKLEPKTGKSVNLVDESGKKFDNLRGADSIMYDVRDYINGSGGDYTIAGKWMYAQAGNSFSDGAIAFKHYLAKQRNVGLDKYYWEQDDAKGLDEYKDAISTSGLAKYAQTMVAFHAFNYELVTKTALPNKNEDGSLTLIRTESKELLEQNGFKVGDTNLTMMRPVTDSASLVKAVQIFGSEVTEVKVPPHRVLGVYAYTRSPGNNDGAFAGDSENEVVAMLDGLPFNYVKEGKKKAKTYGYEPLSDDLMKPDSDLLNPDLDTEVWLEDFKKKFPTL